MNEQEEPAVLDASTAYGCEFRLRNSAVEVRTRFPPVTDSCPCVDVQRRHLHARQAPSQLFRTARPLAHDVIAVA